MSKTHKKQGYIRFLQWVHQQDNPLHSVCRANRRQAHSQVTASKPSHGIILEWPSTRPKKA
jgi:hypothetical protein